MIAFALATLIVGMIAGFFAQRSGLCFMGGYRDYFAFRNTSLLRGAIAFFLGAALGYVILSALGMIYFADTFPWTLFKGSAAIPGSVVKTTALATTLLVAIIGGFGVGFFSVFAGGCPLRQTVMASEGNRSSILYLVGLLIGAPLVMYIFYLVNPLGLL